MIFGKIDYLNLLPFHVFLKRHVKSTRLQAVIAYKKGVPSEVNKAFKKRTVNAAFISSIESGKYSCVDLGIVAKKEVLSVLVLQGKSQPDSASATSNALAKLLDQEGKVLIGDAALRHFLEHKQGVDLAALWHAKTGLPFVFARLCYHEKKCLMQKLVNGFNQHNQKIPYYILKKASQTSGVSIPNIKMYLEKITYRLGPAEHKALNKFLQAV